MSDLEKNPEYQEAFSIIMDMLKKDGCSAHEIVETLKRKQEDGSFQKLVDWIVILKSTSSEFLEELLKED